MNQLDQDILKLKEDKKVLQSLERLIHNADFKKVIMDDFLTTHAINLVQSKGKLLIPSQTNQDIDRQLDCVALFKMYLDQRIAMIADIDLLISDAETLRSEQTRNF